MGTLRILSLFKLFTLAIALASYNLVPDLSVLRIEGQTDTYAKHHGTLQTYFQLQENIELKKEFTQKIVFHFSGDGTCLKERFVNPFSSPQLNQVSSFIFHPNLTPRAPPIIS